MLKQASIKQIRSGDVSKDDGYLVVAMCHYPRGLKSNVIDEYRADLAPDRDLFAEWKRNEEKNGHERAFIEVAYENRFSLTTEALNHLKGLSDFAEKQDIYLVCQCELGERCHREMLLLTAKGLYGTTIDKVFHSYPEYLKRVISREIIPTKNQPAERTQQKILRSVK